MPVTTSTEKNKKPSLIFLHNPGIIFPLLFIAFLGGCGDSQSDMTEQKAAPEISFKNITCPSLSADQICRDIGDLLVEYSVSDTENQSVSISGHIASEALGIMSVLEDVDGILQSSLNGFGDASDVVVTITATNSEGVSKTISAKIGSVDKNDAAFCTAVQSAQNFQFNDGGGTATLIDSGSCVDPENDDLVLTNIDLDTTLSGDYTQTINVSDSYGAGTNYVISGNIAAANLTAIEFANQLKANPQIIGADSCFDPVNVVFDEVVICDFNSEWEGFQYNSIVDTASFNNVALADSAQGFISAPLGNSLETILSGFSKIPRADNQAVAVPGTNDIVVMAAIDRDQNGLYSNLNLTGEGFRLEGATTENSLVSCENGSYQLPSNSLIGPRSSVHTIDQPFIENIGSSIRISNCIATNPAGKVTALQGDIDIAITDAVNQNPIINSFSGLAQGFEGISTIIANVQDPEQNMDSVNLRYRLSGSTGAWTEIPLIQIPGTDNYSQAVSFTYATNLDENGIIEYQIVANDLFGGQSVSALTSVLFYANEDTAQITIENELNIDANKIVTCFDCTFLDVTGSPVGPFDALYVDAASNNYSYEYNGEQRTAQALLDLETSSNANGYLFFNIPLSSVSEIRNAIQSN